MRSPRKQPVVILKQPTAEDLKTDEQRRRELPGAVYSDLENEIAALRKQAQQDEGEIRALQMRCDELEKNWAASARKQLALIIALEDLASPVELDHHNERFVRVAEAAIAKYKEKE